MVGVCRFLILPPGTTRAAWRVRAAASKLASAFAETWSSEHAADPQHAVRDYPGAVGRESEPAPGRGDRSAGPGETGPSQRAWARGHRDPRVARHRPAALGRRIMGYRAMSS